MIRPNEVPKQQREPDDARIEAFFDKNLSQGVTRIGHTRSGWDMRALERVLDKYRANGWRVTDTGAAYVFEPAETASL